MPLIGRHIMPEFRNKITQLKKFSQTNISKTILEFSFFEPISHGKSVFSSTFKLIVLNVCTEKKLT